MVFPRQLANSFDKTNREDDHMHPLSNQNVSIWTRSKSPCETSIWPRPWLEARLKPEMSLLKPVKSICQLPLPMFLKTELFFSAIPVDPSVPKLLNQISPTPLPHTLFLQGFKPAMIFPGCPSSPCWMTKLSVLCMYFAQDQRVLLHQLGALPSLGLKWCKGWEDITWYHGIIWHHMASYGIIWHHFSKYCEIWHTVDGCEILYQLVTIGNCDGISHLPTAAGFRIS